MISDVMGLCRICKQSHELPICGAVLERQNLRFTVYNTICNFCVKKVDYVLKNNLIFNEEDEKPIYNGKRKIVSVDAATNTDGIKNYEYQINQQILNNSARYEEKKLSESTSSNEQDVQFTSSVKRKLQRSAIQDESKSQRCLFCEFCKKKFIHSGDLNKHRRKHTGERPYNCSLCNRKFSHSSNLIRHKRLHSGEKPFSCPLKCGKTFSRKDKLSNHVSKHHPDT